MGNFQEGRPSSAFAGSQAACSRVGRRAAAGLLYRQAVALRRFVVGAVLALAANAGLAEVLVGRVVSVADGDTLTVLDASRRQHKIRLAGIDAPEKKQPFGNVSRQSLGQLTHGKQVLVEWHKRDRYGRLIGKV